MLVVLVGHIHESHVAGKSTIFCVWIDASKLLPKEQCKHTGDRNCLCIRGMALISSGIGCSWGQGRLLFGDLHLLHTEIFRDNPSFVQCISRG